MVLLQQCPPALTTRSSLCVGTSTHLSICERLRESHRLPAREGGSPESPSSLLVLECPRPIVASGAHRALELDDRRQSSRRPIKRHHLTCGHLIPTRKPGGFRPSAESRGECVHQIPPDECGISATDVCTAHKLEFVGLFFLKDEYTLIDEGPRSRTQHCSCLQHHTCRFLQPLFGHGVVSKFSDVTVQRQNRVSLRRVPVGHTTQQRQQSFIINTARTRSAGVGGVGSCGCAMDQVLLGGPPSRMGSREDLRAR